MKHFVVCLLLAMATHSLADPTNFPTQQIKIRGDLTLNEPSTTTNFHCPTVNVDNFNAQNVTCDSVTSNKAKVQTLDVKSITGSNGGVTIDADVVLNGGGNVQELIAATITSNAQNIWLLASHDSFERINALTQWNEQRTTNCGENNPNGHDSNFLGGPCVLAQKEIQKSFENLPEHTFVMVKAKYHMFDNWAGESGYMKLNQETVWTHNGEVPTNGKGVNVCGGETPDPAYNLAIDVTIPHKGDTLLITFGSTLTQDACHASYGVDDVEVYVK